MLAEWVMDHSQSFGQEAYSFEVLLQTYQDYQIEVWILGVNFNTLKLFNQQTFFFYKGPESGNVTSVDHAASAIAIHLLLRLSMIHGGG